MKFKSLILILIFGLAMAACDEGKIYPTTGYGPRQGRTVRLSGDLRGVDSYPEGYTLSLSGFSDESEYAVISRNVLDAGGTLLEGIPDEVTRVSLCVIDRLRKPVVEFGSIPLGEATDTVEMEVGQLDCSMFGAIDRAVFQTTCAQCHGATGYAAGGLNLTTGRAYGDLVGVPSRVVPGETRVVAGESANSLLYKALSTGMSATWRYDHSSEVVNPATLELIRDWIDNGAKN